MLLTVKYIVLRRVIEATDLKEAVLVTDFASEAQICQLQLKNVSEVPIFRCLTDVDSA